MCIRDSLLGIAALFACSDDNTEPPVPAPVEPDKATIELDVTNVQLFSDQNNYRHIDRI